MFNSASQFQRISLNFISFLVELLHDSSPHIEKYLYICDIIHPIEHKSIIAHRVINAVFKKKKEKKNNTFYILEKKFEKNPYTKGINNLIR